MAPKSVSVTLDKRDEKKNSVKFTTDQDTSPDNIYITNDVVKKLGDPKAVKITITAA